VYLPEKTVAAEDRFLTAYVCLQRCSYNAVGSLKTANNPGSSPVPVCANQFLFDTVLGRGDNSTLFAKEESMVVSDGNAIQDVFSYHGYPKSGPQNGTIGESVPSPGNQCASIDP